jgi:uracil-DNA glycosylase
MRFNLQQLPDSWRELIEAESSQPYFRDIERRLDTEAFYPAADLVFRALKLTPLDQVKVVILGQDPYHGVGQANGLAFAVSEGTALPPSLRNIYKELANEYPGLRVQRGPDGKPSGDLSGWARQGVLLLNTALTVHPHEAGSHSGIGWHILTGRIVEHLSSTREGIVFVLWGAHAQSRRRLVDESRHTVIATAHPSPLSAHRGFFGSNCFRRVNDALVAAGASPIRWEMQSRV